MDYHEADAQLLVDEVQQEYVRLYGFPDGTPVDRDEFSPPKGHFAVLYEAGRPVAMGGWRFSEDARIALDRGCQRYSLALAPASRATGADPISVLNGARQVPHGRLDPGRVVELKRMYVRPASRGRGHARTVLAHLENTAARAGAGRIVLETGAPQHDAVALYRSSGYRPIAAFGHYADSPLSVPLGKRLTPAI